MEKQLRLTFALQAYSSRPLVVFNDPFTAGCWPLPVKRVAAGNALMYAFPQILIALKRLEGDNVECEI